MNITTSITAMNAKLARQIDREARQDPTSIYAGKYVGIANGKVVAVADTLDEASEAVLAVEPDNRRCRIVDTVGDYETVYDS